MEHFDHISKLQSSLNVFERLWETWYAYMNNDVLATGIMSFVMHEIVYFGRSLPWMIIDASGIFRKYKIQAVSRWHHALPYLYMYIKEYSSTDGLLVDGRTKYQPTRSSLSAPNWL